MSLRVCAEPGCPNLQDQTRCVKHRREREQKRGSSTQRGYDYQHQQERAAWLPAIATGGVTCRRAPFGLCRAKQATITPTDEWDLGHPDSECPAPKAPEHAGCNRATATRCISPDA